MAAELFIAIIAANLLGIAYGIYFYSGQLMATNPLLWIFVIDCPLYVIFAVLCFFRAVRSPLFRFIASVGLIKYGAWTLFVLFFHSSYYLVPPFFMGTLLVLAHSGMVLESLAIMPKKVNWKFLAVSIGWFLLNDALDYAFGLHPRIPGAGLEYVALFTLAMTFISTFLVYRYSEEVHASEFARKTKRALGIPQ